MYINLKKTCNLLTAFKFPFPFMVNWQNSAVTYWKFHDERKNLHQVEFHNQKFHLLKLWDYLFLIQYAQGMSTLFKNAYA